MRKYIIYIALLGAAAAVIGAIGQTDRGTHDWKHALVWVGWGIDVAIAVGTVVEQNRAARELEAQAESGD